MVYLKAILGKLDLDRFVKLKAEGMNTDGEILEFIMEYIPKSTIVHVFEKHYGQEYVPLDEHEIEPSVLAPFEFDVLRSALILPYDYNSLTKTYYFALNNFIDTDMRNSVTLMCRKNGSNATFKFSFKKEIEEAFSRIAPEISNPIKREPLTKPVSTPVASRGDFDAPSFVSGLINKSLDLKASDLHVERVEQGLQVRYRVDGVMTEKAHFNVGDSDISSIYVRLKGISAMDISEKRKPQDGRIDNYEYQGRYYDFRVSTVTTVLGEKAVLRIFDKTSGILSFDQLGFAKEETEKVKSMLHSQNGIILMAGATGSGKTTTLYTMIDEINSDEINIYTIEDPVEKTVEGVNQILIDPKAGIDYPSTLKALLRQDPDVIVVGEIRDPETAGLSIRASLTGHLVLSTIHANGALDAISRLLDMGVEAYLLAASSQGFLSQRLVRRLCPHCRVKAERPRPHEAAWIKKISEEFNLTLPDGAEYYEPGACPKCVNGYRGRVAIVEVIKVTESIRNLLSSGASMSTIREKALEEGFIPMEVNALNKALAGVTSMDEVVRKLS